jgi:hypothetical protein
MEQRSAKDEKIGRVIPFDAAPVRGIATDLEGFPTGWRDTCPAVNTISLTEHQDKRDPLDVLRVVRCPAVRGKPEPRLLGLCDAA